MILTAKICLGGLSQSRRYEELNLAFPGIVYATNPTAVARATFVWASELSVPRKLVGIDYLYKLSLSNLEIPEHPWYEQEES